MTTTTTPAVTPISDDVLALAKIFGKEITIDKDTGAASMTAEAYEANMPEGLTKPIIEQLQKYNTTTVAAVALALGDLGIPLMKKHEKLENIKLVMPLIGKDTLNVSFDRSRSVPSGTEDGVTKLAYGSVSARFDTYAAGNRGDYKRVKTMLAEKANEAFDKAAKK